MFTMFTVVSRYRRRAKSPKRHSSKRAYAREGGGGVGGTRAPSTSSTWQDCRRSMRGAGVIVGWENSSVRERKQGKWGLEGQDFLILAQPRCGSPMCTCRGKGATVNIGEFLDQVRAQYASGQATEHSYRPALHALFESIDPALTVINEPKKSEAACPTSFSTRRVPFGWAEAKDIDKDVIKPEGLFGRAAKTVRGSIFQPDLHQRRRFRVHP